jgi:hypothetical protein
MSTQSAGATENQGQQQDYGGRHQQECPTGVVLGALGRSGTEGGCVDVHFGLESRVCMWCNMPAMRRVLNRDVNDAVRGCISLVP